MAIDMNANNPDLSKILTNMYEDQFHVMEDYIRWRFPIDETEKQLIVIKPIEPKWSGAEQWDFLKKVLKNEKNSASIAIVDTHPSIQHLMGTQTNFKTLGLDIYHIWDLAAPDKPDELGKIDMAIKWFHENLNFEDENIIHVFNPHSAKTPRKFFSSSLRNHWKKYYGKKIKKVIAVSWNTIKEKMLNLNLEFSYKTDLSPSKLFEPWGEFFGDLAETIENMSKECKKGRCAIVNVLPIFEHFDLSNFVVGQTYAKNRNLRGIQDDLGKFYTTIEKFEKLRSNFKL